VQQAQEELVAAAAVVVLVQEVVLALECVVRYQHCHRQHHRHPKL